VQKEAAEVERTLRDKTCHKLFKKQTGDRSFRQLMTTMKVRLAAL